MQVHQVYLCTDLDRTLLPNGDLPEPPAARDRFASLVARPEVGLVYVSGRDQSLIREAMKEYALPQPDFVIADVGTTVYQVDGDHWQVAQQWHELISRDWQGLESADVAASLGEVVGLSQQASSKQGRFKLSFERQPAAGLEGVVADLKHRLERLHYVCHCVVSVDETTDTGLVDVLPASANKCTALHFLCDYLGISQDRMVFSGDSGNDFDVLLSSMRATLVGNATNEVRNTAIKMLARHQGGNLYLARQNYAAGILEGFYHYFPQYHTEQQECT